MVRDGILKEISEPTDWCFPMVPVLKPSGNVRICADYEKLNESIKRELYMLPILDDIAPKVAGMTMFSKLDGTPEPRILKIYDVHNAIRALRVSKSANKLLVGLTFCRKKITELLQGLDNVDAIMDDIIVYGRDMAEHDAKLTAVHYRVNEAGLKLNKEKCLFRQTQLEYFRHVINSAGISPNPKKAEAIRNLDPTPERHKRTSKGSWHDKLPWALHRKLICNN